MNQSKNNRNKKKRMSAKHSRRRRHLSKTLHNPLLKRGKDPTDNTTVLYVLRLFNKKNYKINQNLENLVHKSIELCFFLEISFLKGSYKAK